MTSLVVCLGEGKGTWGQVSSLLNSHNWDNIFIVANSFFQEKFSHEKKFEFVIVDSRKSIDELKKDIINSLKDKLSGDVAINIISGSGQEHMAIFSALLNLGVGIRLVVSAKEGMKEI